MRCVAALDSCVFPACMSRFEMFVDASILRYYRTMEVRDDEIGAVACRSVIHDYENG